MTLEQIGQIVCMVYFTAMAWVGLGFAFDFIKTYSFYEPSHRTIAVIALVAVVLFLGFFPFVLVGIYAVALATTSMQEKRKR